MQNLNLSHKKVFLLIIIVVVFSFALFAFIFHSFQKERLEEIQTTYFSKVKNSFELNKQKHLQEHYIEEMQNFINPQVIEMLYNGQREKLLQYTQTKFKKLQANDKYLHLFHFHLADGRSFLRVHEPKTYGDTIASHRELVKYIHKYHKQVSGFELGITGFYYRNLLPLFHKGKYIGALELGVSPQKVLDYVISFNQVEGKINFSDPKLSTDFGDFSNIKSTLLEEILKKKLSRVQYISLENEHYALYSFKILSHSQKELGEFIFLQNLEQYYEGYFKTLIKMSILFFSFALFFIFFIFILLRRSTQQSDALHARVSSILNAQKNLVIVSHKGRSILECNQAFLDFVDFASLQEFREHYECVCDLFIEEDAYLHKFVGEQSWIEFILSNPKQMHLVKMKNKDQDAIFHISVEYLSKENQDEVVVTFEDITEQILIQRRLEEERDLFSSGPVVTIEWSPKENWPVLYVSKNVADVLGFSPFEMYENSFVFAHHIHPDDIDRVNEEVSHYIETQTARYEQSYRLRMKNGEYRWIYDFNYLSYDTAGKLQKIRGYLFDQTHLKEVEASYALEQERLARIIDGTNVGTWEWNIQTGEILFNDKWAQNIGYSLEEITPTTVETWKHFTHPQDLQKSQSVLQECIEGQREFYDAKIRMLHKDGRYVWIHDRGKVTQYDTDGKALIMSGTHSNIDQEEKLKEEIKRNEEMLQELFENMGNGVAIYEAYNGGEDFIFKDVNKASLEMERLQREDIIGKKLSVLFPAAIDMGLLDVLKEVYVSSKAKKLPVSLYNDGRISAYRENFVYKISSGELVVIYTDMTDQMQAREKLEQLNTELQKANEAKSQFLANMSHEIRTPMNAIIGLSELLQDTALDHKQKEFLEKIYGSSKMLLAIINDILDFSKLEANKLELESLEFPLEDLLGQLRTLFSSRSTHQGIELYFHQKNDLPVVVLGDQLRLEQVLTNLLSNALKFTHEGMVIFTIELKERYSQDRARIGFSVEDSGIGMSPQEQEKLFEAFSQADSSTTRKYGGTGLGLMIAAKIVEAYGSKINVQSVKGKGSCFSFEIDMDVLSWEKVKNSEHRDLHRILVVDDQEISRTIMKDMLDHFEYGWEEAKDGLEAIEKIQKAQKEGRAFDYLVLDWHMPHLDGVATLKKLQTLRLQKPIQTMMISAYEAKELDLQALGVDHFLAKPITLQSFYKALQELKGEVLRGSKQRSVAIEIPDLRDKTILLVEDNEINQEVASMMLEKTGAKVIIAQNGREAIELFEQEAKELCLVLMDLQMPVMSGYEATKEIRKSDTEIPILALSAAAMIEDKQKVLSWGMNDHLAKPIESAQLYQKLTHYCKAEILTQEQIMSQEKKLEVLNESYLESTISSPELQEKLLSKLLKQLQEEFNALDKLLTTDLKQAQEKVHTLKGISGNLGAERLSHLSTQIDLMLKEEQTISETKARELQEAIEELQELLMGRTELLAQKDQKLLDLAEFQALLEEILEKLEANTILSDEEQERMLYNIKNSLQEDRYRSLQEALDELEFDDAIEILEEYLHG